MAGYDVAPTNDTQVEIEVAQLQSRVNVITHDSFDPEFPVDGK